jgi:amidohydrolase
VTAGVLDGLAAERAALEPELREVRRALHRQPELAFAEHRTAELVAGRLRRLGLAPRTGIAGTGVMADLDTGRAGPTLLLRAELDALPVQERAGRPYGSAVPGVMHACGHDAHVSALLGTAALLVRRARALTGRVRLLFQPAEELGAGAAAAIAAGALDGVDEAVSAHVVTDFPFAVIGLREGETALGVDLFALTVAGQGRHSAALQRRRDPVLAAAQLVTRLQSAVPDAARREETLTVASLEGGTAANVVAQAVTLRGSLRWIQPAVRAQALAGMREIADGVCGELGVTYELSISASVPVLRCAGAPTALLAGAAAAAGARMVFDPGVIPGSDDFAHIAERVPSAFAAVGAGGRGCGPHHSPDFDIDERSIGLTAEILTRAVISRLISREAPR